MVDHTIVCKTNERLWKDEVLLMKNANITPDWHWKLLDPINPTPSKKKKVENLTPMF